jgi:hypothetical protein
MILYITNIKLIAPPPSNTTDIFNPNSYPNSAQVDGNDTLTLDTAKEYFLSYPIAQGYQSMPLGANVTNGFTADNIILSDSLTFSDSSIQTSAGIAETVANSLYASLTNDNTLNGNNTFSNEIVASSGVKFSDNSVQTSAGITQTTADSLYASLTNDNTLSGVNTFNNLINFGTNNSIINNFGGSGSLGFVNNNQFTGTVDDGFSFWQAYLSNPNYPLFKFNFQNNGQMLLYNNNNQVLFSVSATAGLSLYNNATQIFLVDNTGDVYLTGNRLIRATASLTITPQQNLYLNAGKNGGALGDVRLNTNSPGCNTYIDDGNVILSQTGSLLQFPDTTQQTTAYIPQSVSAGSYTNSNLTVNSKGQITAISNGTSGPTNFTIISNTGTSTWSFSIPSQLYGTIFSYQLFSPISGLTTASQTNLAIPMNYGQITNNGSLIFASGNGMYQPISMTSANAITYCAGYSQQYSLNQTGFGYVLNIVSNIGSTITTSTTAGTVTENTGTCPPTANDYPGSTINFNSSVNITSCSLTMIITIII